AQDTPLWFFAALFVTHLLFYIIARSKRMFSIAALVILSAAIGFVALKILPFRLPWSIEISLIAVIFYSVGFLAQEQKFFRECPSAIFSLSLFLILTIIQLTSITHNNMVVDMNNGRFGNPFYFFTGAFSGILAWTLIAKYLPEFRLASIVSRETIVIFPLHAFVFTLITGFSVFVLRLPYDFKNNSLPVSFLYMIVAIAVLIPVARIIRKRAPWVIGAEKPRKIAVDKSQLTTKISPVFPNQIGDER
ncbi:MAG: hypothetical protein ACRD63_14045, partial [Pyrinomonadaceae bacterium]